MAELRNYEPSFSERLAEAISGDDYNTQRAVSDQLDKLGGIAGIGLYATPAAPAAATYDLYGLGRMIAEPVTKFIDSFKSSPLDEPEATRDEFFAKKRAPRKSLSDAQSDAENAVRSSPAYLKAIENGQRTTAQKMIDKARVNAAAGWEADQKNLATEEQRIEGDWQAELADREKRRDEYYAKGWQERHPSVANAAAVASYALPFLLARRGFNKIADEGKLILGNIEKARASGNLADESRGLLELQAWRDRVPMDYLKTTGKASLIPGEIRTAGEVYDATFLPPDAEARIRARKGLEHTFTTPEGFATDMLPAIGSGLATSALAGLTARKAPIPAASANLGYLSATPAGAGRGYGQSADDVSILLGDARRRALESAEANATRPTGLGALPRPAEPVGATNSLPGGIGALEDSVLVGTTKRAPARPRKPAEGRSKNEPKKSEKKAVPSATPEQQSAASDELKRFLTPREGGKFASGGVVHAVEPTDAQKKAGNYKKDHIRFQGLDISIENKKGSTRSGVDKGGKTWSVTMPAAYGYFKRTEGKDGDHVDCYIGPDQNSDRVFVVDQIDAASGKFDEHKVMLGYPSKADALTDYRKAFSDGKADDRIGGVASMSVEGLKTWLRSGNTKAPLSRAKYASGGEVLPSMRDISSRDEPIHVGPLHSTVAGRTDHLPISVMAGSYVLPADIISALGEGNTNAGMQIVESLFPAQPQKLEYARGGKVPIAAAGGEFVLTPEQVAAIGGGDLEAGQEILDHWVTQTRAHTIDTLSKLPGPAK